MSIPELYIPPGGQLGIPGPKLTFLNSFITLAPTPWLDGKHSIFGRVSSGMDVVRKMGLVKTDAQDKPVENVSIIGATRAVEVQDQDLA